ncbi:Phosphoglucosamine mutase [Marinomonas spartinae]|uniref:Phosphoglucosamine mutase n=1 Tax=Marinomonas spartinae TaxID=1792290 RepID=A0A1A8T7C0_9GAMM|nr:phosphomannomutase [Marinomonas spartinae]SBS27037.1 Phosphoglucosamine mutase [Marinomonas spartinae]
MAVKKVVVKKMAANSESKLVNVDKLSQQLGVAFGTSGVRGLVKDLTPELCFAYTASFLQAICPTAKCVAIGMDLRPSSPEIAKACIIAAKAADIEVINCGTLPTPALAYYAMQNNIPGVMITGSHIPFDRNGIKFYRPDGEISKADEASIMAGQVSISETLLAQVVQSELPQVNEQAIALFKQRYIDLFPASMLTGKRIGVYEHSSVARDVIKELLVHFGAEVISLERTDTFVPIDTEAVSVEDKQKGLDWAKTHNLDAIISTDGDGDRPLIANEQGEWLRGDILGVLCAGYLNATHVAAPININTMLELQNPDRKTLRTKIGSPYVIEGMEALLKDSPDARVVGYEANGGFLVGGDFMVNGQTLNALPTRDSILPALIVLAMSYEQKRPISQLTAGFPKRYTASDRIKNIPTSVSKQLITDFKASKEKQAELLDVIADEGEVLEMVLTDETDGFRMTLSNGNIIHFRPSGNAPELRVYVETGVDVNSLIKDILVYIQRVMEV